MESAHCKPVLAYNPVIVYNIALGNCNKTMQTKLKMFGIVLYIRLLA